MYLQHIPAYTFERACRLYLLDDLELATLHLRSETEVLAYIEENKLARYFDADPSTILHYIMVAADSIEQAVAEALKESELGI